MMWQHFNWVDQTIMAIIACSTIIGLCRGFIREIISLIAWSVALFIAITYAQAAQAYLPVWLASQTLRYFAAFMLLFVATVVMGMFVNMMIGFWVNKSSLSITNRLIGIVFGALRGVAMVVLGLFLLMNVSTVNNTAALQASVLAVRFMPCVIYLQNLLPPSPAKQKAN